MRARKAAGAWQVAGAWCTTVEGALLGRVMTRSIRALDEAIACCGGGAWCDRCGATLDAHGQQGCRPGTSRTPCGACADEGPFDAFVRLGRYEPPLSTLVRRVKRDAMHAMAHEIGVRLGLVVRARMPTPAGGWLVVPIPGNLWRRLARGIDHANTMAAGVACSLECSVARVMRMRRVERQAALGRQARWARQARTSLLGSARERVRSRSIVLVDDIRTTGATLLKARELLVDAGASQVVAAVACVTDEFKLHA